jgi:hypothetical protein
MAGGITILVVAVALGVCLVMVRPWNGNAETRQEKTRDAFASDREVAAEPTAFDAKRAIGYLEAICKIGPRISGTEGMKKQRELLEKHFKDRGGKIEWQNFTARQRSVRKDVDMKNLIVSWHPDRKRRVILCSHYDTRPIADQEHDTRKWRQPFVSANDGGSGVALLMELAHHVKDMKLNVGVDFVFFDGEEYVMERDDDYFFGSKHFASEYKKNRKETKRVFGGAILLDMVGGKKPHFPIEQNSWKMAAPLAQAVWNIADELKCTAFDGTSFSETEVLDDHIALNRCGIPAIDVIDFKYPHWHRLTDVPENCSGESLQQVARVLSVWLQRVK